ncbi:MAG: hypothetical protein ACI8UD_000152 [Planctomycetota bacterium]|jgi:hypothetical protein
MDNEAAIRAIVECADVARRGLAEGLANTILRLVVRRFDVQLSEFETRIRSASVEELDLWTDRVLHVESASDLFTI